MRIPFSNRHHLLPSGTGSTALLLLAAVGISQSATAQTSQLFYDDFQPYSVKSGAEWETANWAVGAPFGCSWNQGNMLNNSKGVSLLIDGSQRRCGEIRTWKHWQYGIFTVRMKPTAIRGTASTFFLYDHNAQISTEFLGGTTKVRTNYRIGDQHFPLTIDLARFGIDPNTALRDYTIDWKSGSITWLAKDNAGKWIQLRRVAVTLPTPMRLMLNSWYGNNAGAALTFPGPFYGGYGSATYSSVWIGKPAITTTTPAPAPAPAPSAPATTMPSYPFASQSLYVDPYSAAAQFVRNGAGGYPIEIMKRISTRPTAKWLGNWNTNVYADVGSYVGRARSAGGMPVFVLYNIPQRDCGSYSAGGTSASAYSGWVEQVALAIGSARAAVIIEPDALSQINQSGCLTDAQKTQRNALLRGAVATIRKNAPNTAIYLDAGNSQWIPSNTMAQLLKDAGVAAANGFALNVSNYISTDASVAYGTKISSLIGGKHFVIDTGRNGLGATADYQWCNPSGRGLGAAPRGHSSGLVDAFLWIKPPGESDGTCNGGPPAGAFWPKNAYDLAVRAQ